jgi:hypothetical protein
MIRARSSRAKHDTARTLQAWPRIESFINDLPFGSLWADVGCGNGKYLNVNRSNTLGIGSDMSAGLLKYVGGHWPLWGHGGCRLPLCCHPSPLSIFEPSPMRQEIIGRQPHKAFLCWLLDKGHY